MDSTFTTSTKAKSLTLTFSRIGNSFFVFLITFAIANIFHQLILGASSFYFGYETVMTFGSVHSYPVDYHYWSTPRVLLIYGLPLTLCSFAALYIFTQFITNNKPRKSIVRLFAFWMLVSLMLVITTYMSVSAFGQMIGGDIYQDISVLGYWYGFDPSSLLAFAFLSIAINFVFGFILGNELLRFSHIGKWQDKKEGRIYLFKTYFFFPLVLGIPGTLLFSYPHSTIFHLVMALHALIFVPAMLIRYRSNFSSEADVAESDFLGKPILSLPVVLVVLLILVRIFLSK